MDVCAYKQDYLDVIKAVENATVARDTSDEKKRLIMILSTRSLLVADITKTGQRHIVPEKRCFETARKIHSLL